MTQNNNNDEAPKTVQIQLTKHEWPDEIATRKAQQRKNAWRTALILILVLCTFAAGIVTGWAIKPSQPQVIDNNGQTTISTSDKFARLESIYNILVTQWYWGKDVENLNQELIDKAIAGMVNSDVDPHTVYMTPTESEQFTTSIDGNFVGIGVQYVMMEGYPLIQKVFRNSPAEAAGVQVGDIILTVDGVDVGEKTSDEIVSMVRGEQGSTVVIEFLRQDDHLTLDIVRAPVNTGAYWEVLDGNIGYLEITTFGMETGTEVNSALEDLKAQGVTSLIIDLRDNGGGYLISVQNIAGFFLPKGSVVLQQEYIDGSVDQTRTTGATQYSFDKIIVLTNENTASAAEVLSAALSELIDATLVGTNTYGKGTVQETRSFADGSALKYTVAQWLTPEGKKIHGEGIAPDVEVKLHAVFYEAWPEMAEEETYSYDSVGEPIRLLQLSLDFLGYPVSRSDGYFDQSTLTSLKQFQSDLGMESTGVLTKDVLSAVYTKTLANWSLKRDLYDTQLDKAIELAK